VEVKKPPPSTTRQTGEVMVLKINQKLAEIEQGHKRFKSDSSYLFFPKYSWLLNCEFVIRVIHRFTKSAQGFRLSQGAHLGNLYCFGQGDFQCKEIILFH